MPAKNGLHVPRSVKNACDFDRALFASIDDKVTPHMPKTQRLCGQIAAEMSHAGRLGKFAKGGENLIADAVSRIGVLKLNRVILSNLVQFHAGGRSDDIIAHRLPLRNSVLFCFICAEAWSPGIPSPRSS